VENVYLSEYEQLRRDPDSELPESLRGLGLPNLYGGRPRYGRESRVHRYAWAVPDDAALRIMAKHAPIVEIGAGTGYWAALLRARGVDIVAYDKDPPDGGEGHPFHAARRAWTDVAVGGPEKAAEHPDRTLFLCWPPYDDPMAADCLREYRGDVVIYVGEGKHGCTADDTFHDMLAADWHLVRAHSIPQWAGVHDRLFVYRRGPAPDAAPVAPDHLATVAVVAMIARPAAEAVGAGRRITGPGRCRMNPMKRPPLARAERETSEWR